MLDEEARRKQLEEASSLSTSSQQLETLSADPHLRIVVAGNPASPAKLLARLARDQDIHVRRAVASNPNTLWSALEDLAKEFPYEVLHNPVGQLQILTHPNKIRSNDVFWSILLQVAEIPALWWNWLTSQPAASTNQAVRLHIQYAGEASHPYGVSRQGEERPLLTLVDLLTAACAQGVSLPPLPENIQTGKPRLTIEQIATEHLRWLASCVEKPIRQGVAWRPQTPGEALQALALDEDEQVRRAVASNEQAPAEVLHGLAEDKEVHIRSAVAGNTQAPAKLLQMLAHDPLDVVRQAVASHPQAPGEALWVLAQDRSVDIRERVASNAQAPLELLQILAQDKERLIRMATAQNARASVEILSLLAQDQRAGVRQNVAAHPQTPVTILYRLARDRSAGVRWNVASHPQAPVEILHMLSLDAHAIVRQKVASHPQVPGQILQDLALDQDKFVRRQVALHPQTSEPVLQTLALDQDKLVRRQLALHPQIPLQTLHILARDADAPTRRNVASQCQAPEEILRLLAQDLEPGVRRRIATHPRMPREILQTLAQDSDMATQRLAQIALDLLGQIEEVADSDKWREILHLFFLRYWIIKAPIEWQLDRIASSNIPEPLQQMLIATLTTNWDMDMIWALTHVGWTFRPEILRSRQNDFQRLLTNALPPLALQKLTLSISWEIRYVAALHKNTSWEARQRLSQDGNRYVRAMARARLGTTGQV